MPKNPRGTPLKRKAAEQLCPNAPAKKQATISRVPLDGPLLLPFNGKEEDLVSEMIVFMEPTGNARLGIFTPIKTCPIVAGLLSNTIGGRVFVPKVGIKGDFEKEFYGGAKTNQALCQCYENSLDLSKVPRNGFQIRPRKFSRITTLMVSFS